MSQTVKNNSYALFNDRIGNTTRAKVKALFVFIGKKRFYCVLEFGAFYFGSAHAFHGLAGDD